MSKIKQKKISLPTKKIIIIILIILLISFTIYFILIQNILNLKNNPKNILSLTQNSLREKIISLTSLISQLLIHKPSPNILEKNIKEKFSIIFQERLNSQNLKYASSSQVDEFGDIKIFLQGTENEAGYIILNTKNNNPDEIWINFISGIANPDLKEKLKDNLKNLIYIDLRFNNKIFYKFKK